MLNRIVLIGRLTRDPELRYTPTGVAVCNFRIAVNRPFRNQNGEYDADFFNIVCWRKLAEIVAQNITKGRLVAVDGRLQMRFYETSSGDKRTAYEVVADTVRFLESKNQQEYEDTEDEYDDNLPF